MMKKKFEGGGDETSNPRLKEIFACAIDGKIRGNFS
jgi:hypothetical protein